MSAEREGPPPSSGGLGPGLSRGSVLLIFGLALLLRLACLADAVSTPLWDWHTWSQSDMDTYVRVSQQILHGDLLVRDPFHPYNLWHRSVAPAQVWQGWYGPHVFHQAPGYYYFLAGLLKLFGSLTAVKLVQLLLGAIHAVLLAALAQRILGHPGGFLVGTLAATYGPFIAAELMILREGLGLILATAAAYLVIRALDSTRPGPWLGAGVVLAMGALTKETGFVLFAAVCLWLAVRALRSATGRAGGRDPRLLVAPAWVIAGFLLGTSPLVVRNLAVGAAPLALSPQGAVNFVLGNAADSPSGGVIFVPPPSFGGIMRESQGRVLSTVVATLRGYRDRPQAFLRNLWRKFSAVWSNVELPDNFSYAYFVLHSALLRSLPRFVCIWLPAALGLCLFVFRGFGRRGWRQEGTGAVGRPSMDQMWLLFTILAAQAGAQSLAPVVARYRLVLVPFLMVFAGWAFQEALVPGPRWGWRKKTLPLAAGLLVLWGAWRVWPMDPNVRKGALRAADFGTGAGIFVARNQFDRAFKEIDRGISTFRAWAPERVEPSEEEWILRRTRLWLFLSHGRFDQVQEDWALLRLALPGDPLVKAIEEHKQASRPLQSVKISGIARPGSGCAVVLDRRSVGPRGRR